MLYEIDFLPVGEGEKSGDAICLRYSFDNGSSWSAGVVDGGTTDAAEVLCEHIEKYYDTDTLDFVVCTHPEQDHAAGLQNVLENLQVQKLIMHCPWDYVEDIYGFVTDGRITKNGLRQRLIEGHPYAYKVYEIAKDKEIPIVHGFSDRQNHRIPCLTIAGPSYEFYLKCVVNFRSIAEITEAARSQVGLAKGLVEAAKRAARWISETWDQEMLTDPEEDATSSENNSSMVLHFGFGGKKKLLTADAGVAAVQQAANYLENAGVVLREFSFYQAPHHGSKRNLGPTVLNRLIGHALPQDTPANFTAFISASKEGSPKHPNKRVVNALIRRGAKVIATQGSTKHHFSPGVPDRDGWTTAEPLPFYERVESDDQDD